MNIHKRFIDQLGHHRKATVGDIIKELGLLTFDGNRITDLGDNLPQIEQIFYTVDFLTENNFVTIVERNIGNSVPDFDPNNFISGSHESGDATVDRIFAMPDYLQSYWGTRLLANPSYFKMVDNGYKTDQEKKEIQQFRWSIIVALVAAAATAIFTKLLDIIC